MKHTHLSNFQKQQYTSYLETQLEKFSAFMLCQRKENEKYKALEEVLSHHQKILDHLQSKLQIVDVYQSQVLSNEQVLFKKCQKINDYEIRLTRLEDRDRFDCDREARKNYHKERKQLNQQEKNGDISLYDLNKRLKNVEEKINKPKETSKNNTFIQNEVLTCVQDTLASKIKKTQKKMKKYFASKFQDIELLLHKSKKHRSKSPKLTPKDVSISSRYQIQCSQTPLTQFRLQDSAVNKSQVSTVLRDSQNTTISNRNKVIPEMGKKKTKKTKKDDEKSNRSKSKSKTKEKSKSKSKKKRGERSRSHSRSQLIEHSYSIGDRSCCRSSLSRSKSNLSREEKSGKRDPKEKRNKKKKDRSVSKSLTDRSSISLHQKCKRRPDFESLILQHKQKSKEKKAHPKKKLSKRQ